MLWEFPLPCFFLDFEEIFLMNQCEMSVVCLEIVSPSSWPSVEMAKRHMYCVWSSYIVKPHAVLSIIMTTCCIQSPAWQRSHNWSHLSGRCGLSCQAATWFEPSPPFQVCSGASWNTVYRMKVKYIFALHLRLLYSFTECVCNPIIYLILPKSVASLSGVLNFIWPLQRINHKNVVWKGMKILKHEKVTSLNHAIFKCVINNNSDNNKAISFIYVKLQNHRWQLDAQ